MDQEALQESLIRRVTAVQSRIARAAEQAGRSTDEITLVAVTKTRGPDVVAAAHAAGLRVFGENRAEEAGPKVAAVEKLISPQASPTWHMIGHIQSRKVRDVVTWAETVHSLDSEKLARRLSQAAEEHGREIAVLLEVNISGEAAKYGLAPEQVAQTVEVVRGLPALRLEGLMTVAPIASDQEEVRPLFAALRHLRDDLARRYATLSWRHLSMGMSEDFEAAIAEGATMVRIGRALFGERTL